MPIIGVDLSGPANAANTAVVVFQEIGAVLHYDGMHEGTDGQIHELALDQQGNGLAVFGLDAPLSYQQGGGDRARDAELRQLIVAHGLNPGSVMPPTAPRMGYLTLRGLAVSRLLSMDGVSVVEVHPGATLALRHAPLAAVLAFGNNIDARHQLLAWLGDQGMLGIQPPAPCTSHFVASCAAALAAWKWAHGQSVWVAEAEFPHHPFAFAC